MFLKYDLANVCAYASLRCSLCIFRNIPSRLCAADSFLPPSLSLSRLSYFSSRSCLSTFLYARPATPPCSLRHVLFLSVEVAIPPSASSLRSLRSYLSLSSPSLPSLPPLPLYLSLTLAAGNSSHLLSLFNVVYLARPPSPLRNSARSFLLLCNGAFISSYPPLSHIALSRLSLQPASQPASRSAGRTDEPPYTRPSFST